MVIEIRSKVCKRSQLHAKNNLQLTSDLSLLYLHYFINIIFHSFIHNNSHFFATSINTKLIIVNMCYHFSHTSFGKCHLICSTRSFCLPTLPLFPHLKPLPYHYFIMLKVGGLLSALCFL